MTLPSRVRDYEVWGRLGEGGMSDVWLAKHAVLGVPVVMKTLRHAVLAMDPAAATARLYREARLMARIGSPRVVRAIDAGEHVEADGEVTPYLVEEYVDGIDLAELDRRRRLALGVGLPLWFVSHAMHELCEGLRAAHHTGIVHRDVKPSNAFFAPGAGVRLGDFGIALPQADCARAEISGTVRFMAPEQIRGEAIGRYTDVYGAGVTAYDLRYGRPPWASADEVLEGHRGAAFPPAQSASEASFQHVVRQMIAKAPSARPQDFRDVAPHFAALARSLRPSQGGPRAPLDRHTYALGPVTVTLEVGDIARARADAIVSSANDAMAMRTGVGDALRRRGGDAIEEAAMRGGQRPLGTCIATGAGALDARFVLHAVSAWNEASCVARSTCRALLLSDELGLTSLAFPALGTGAARVTIETCAWGMMSALAWHVAIGGTRLRNVTIVLADEAKLSTFRDVAWDALEADGESDSPRARDLGLPVDDVEVRADGATFLDARRDA